jgi:hypothetical protein
LDQEGSWGWRRRAIEKARVAAPVEAVRDLRKGCRTVWVSLGRRVRVRRRRQRERKVDVRIMRVVREG